MQNRLDAAAKALESLDRNTVEAANAVSQLNNRLDFYASKKFIESVSLLKYVFKCCIQKKIVLYIYTPSLFSASAMTVRMSHL